MKKINLNTQQSKSTLSELILICQQHDQGDDFKPYRATIAEKWQHYYSESNYMLAIIELHHVYGIQMHLVQWAMKFYPFMAKREQEMWQAKQAVGGSAE